MESTRHDVNIILAGEAGQGIQTVEKILCDLLFQSGYYLFSCSEFMSRIRGGENTTTIRIADKPVKSYQKRADLIIYMSGHGKDRIKDRYGSETREIGPSFFDEAAGKAGGPRYLGMAVLGFLTGLVNLDSKAVADAVSGYWISRGQDIADRNLTAAEAGRNLFRSHSDEYSSFSPKPASGKPGKNYRLMEGSGGVAEGALKGGCRFAAAYPMSPSTGVLVSLASLEETHPLIVEQAEDEIAAVNMVLGAWYAGARAMTTTSGGGFALMTEGLSMAGMGEIPAVVHLAQRPGPATGLPTRTEQGDLNLALHAGHGDFPRILLAPGNRKDAVELTEYAFDAADRFQVPVIILTDQHFTDSRCTERIPDTETRITHHVIRTDADYRRYVYTESGISPRGIPGYGEGFVRVDSDEHDEGGRITESSTVRSRMVDKRLVKLATVTEAALPPVIQHGGDNQIAVLCWGSCRETVFEAVDRLRENTGLPVTGVFFPQIYPLPKQAADMLKGKHCIAVEQNVTGQFADLAEKQLGITVSERILKSDGFPFSVEEIESQLLQSAKGRMS
jgi:2-oxoglutarate ferredoxin oxidoreductase subunit alpha